MPLRHGHSNAVFQDNVRHLVRKGYPVNQAVAIAYRVRRGNPRISELGETLSTDFWISPSDAKRALDEVRKSVVSLDLDMQREAAAGTIPQIEFNEWTRWRTTFDNYYQSHTTSFLGWRLLDSTSVLSQAEQYANDLNAWRARFASLVGRGPTTKGPGNDEPPGGHFSSVLVALALVGTAQLLWMVYRSGSK